MDAAALPADRHVEEIPSLCMNCHEEGMTRLLLTTIPFFRDIVLMSFSCPHCHLQNNEIQSAGEIQQRGVKITFKLDVRDDLQRQVVKSDTAVVRFEEVDLEIPAGRGQLTNIEGLVSMVKQDLEAQQPQRKEVSAELWEKVETVVQALGQMAGGESLPFSMTVDDPAGNSSVEPSPADKSGKYIRTEYARSAEQNEALGLGEGASQTSNNPTTETNTSGSAAPDPIIRPEYSASNHMFPSMPANTNGTGQEADTNDEDDIIPNKVYTFPTPCPGCTHPTSTHMKMVPIPHFREVVIMSTACEHCGYRSNEVKTGGEVPEKGRKITLKVSTPEDLTRDILKAESCALECPELSLNVEPGTLGGRFTTVEGLLAQVRDDLKASVFDTGAANSATTEVVPVSDSMPATERSKWDAFFAQLDAAVSGSLPFTMVLTDPLAASYVQSFAAPKPDAQIQVEEYVRTEEEEEHLGLRDMVTEGYEGDPNLKTGEDAVAAAALVDAAATASGEQAENQSKEPIDTDEILQVMKQKMAEMNDD